MSTPMNNIEVALATKTKDEIGDLLYGYIDKGETQKFCATLDTVASSITKGNESNWDLNYIVNVWVKKNNLKRTLLFAATFHNNIDIVECLLKHGADPNVLNANTTHAVYRACFNNNAEIALKLLRAGGDPSIYNTTNDITCMWYAGMHGNIKIFKALCEPESGMKGFDWDNLINKMKSDSGYSAWHLVSEKGHIDCLKYLWQIRKKFKTPIDVLCRIKKSNDTAFSVGCSSDHRPIVKFWIENIFDEFPNFDINQTNNNGRSPFWLVVWKGNLEGAKMMLEKFPNVDVNLKNNMGTSPFKVACEKGRSKTIQYLLTLDKIDPNLQSNALVTPLMTSIQNGSLKCVRILCKDPRVKILGVNDKWNKDALDYCAFYGEILVFQALCNTLLQRQKITNWDELMRAGWFNEERCQSYLKRATDRNNYGYMAYMTNLIENVLKPKKFNLFKNIVGTEDMETTYVKAYQAFLKDSNVASYLYKHCSPDTCQDIANVVNNGLKNQKCGFNDSLLLLSQMVNSSELADSMRECTQKSLSARTKTDRSYNFFKNNFLTSNIWCTTAGAAAKDANNNNDEDVKLGDKDEGVKKEMLFDRVRGSVIDNELNNQKQYIKDSIVAEEKNNEEYWRELKSTIKNFNIGAGQKIRTWETFSKYSIKTDLFDEKGIKPSYKKSELPIDTKSGFNGTKEYDLEEYLSRLLTTAHTLNAEFQKTARQIFTEKLGIKCFYADAPVKTKHRCQRKAVLEYSENEWPYTGSLLDLLRCAVVFESVPDLIQACIKFNHLVDRSQRGGIIKKVLRVKNGFNKIPDESWDVPLSEFDYADIKFNVLIKTKDVAFIAEIQFLLKFMLNAKKKGHAIYGFVRNEDYFSSLSDIVFSKDKEEKDSQIKRYILSTNMGDWSKFLENALKFDKEYCEANEKEIIDFCDEVGWKKGRKVFEQTLKEWNPPADA